MRVIAGMLIVIAAPLIVTGCKKPVTVENVTVTNEMIGNAAAANAMTPPDDGMINYAAPAATGNAAGR